MGEVIVKENEKSLRKASVFIIISAIGLLIDSIAIIIGRAVLDTLQQKNIKILELINNCCIAERALVTVILLAAAIILYGGLKKEEKGFMMRAFSFIAIIFRILMLLIYIQFKSYYFEPAITMAFMVIIICICGFISERRMYKVFMYIYSAPCFLLSAISLKGGISFSISNIKLSGWTAVGFWGSVILQLAGSITTAVFIKVCAKTLETDRIAEINQAEATVSVMQNNTVATYKIPVDK